MANIETTNSICQGYKDRLSDMPDTILHNIMSFMTARQAVQLCVLSKRWKTLWMTLHILNFNDEEFCGVKQTRCVWDRCQEFVSTILYLRRATIDLHTFSITWSQMLNTGTYDLNIRPWIRYVVKHNPRVMIVDIDSICERSRLYPEELFTCPSLEHITLNKCNHTPKTINLPFLRRLHLKFSCLNQDFVSKLLKGCPVLEDLHLEGGLFQFSEITSTSLKHLTIKNLRHPDSQFELVNAPNLLSLHLTICAYRYKNQVNLNLPSLSEACIIFDDCHLKETKVTESRILYGLFNVQSLELKSCSAESMQYWLRTETPICPTFSKLVSLSMGSLCLRCMFHLLFSFVEHCPNLRRLTLMLRSCNCDQKQDKKRQRIHMEQFKCKHLESVEVQFFGSSETADKVVKSLQEATKELGDVSIVTVTKLWQSY